jgi:3-hydroxy-9,10-secoandrosta-1,3,5(10)-triene-9,17-dione monooxygenase
MKRPWRVRVRLPPLLGNELPQETIQEIVNAGLVRLLVPRRWGGHELSFDAFVDSVIEIAKADGSAGWCYSFLLAQAWLLAHFPEEAQRDVWASNPDALFAASLAPVGRFTSVEGGYRLSGNWAWCSGVDHCEWDLLGGLSMPTGPGEHPEPRIFLLPCRDHEILDTWFAVGQKATGSKNVVVNDVFVPEHRTIRLTDLREGHTPGSAVNPGPLYQLPLMAALPLGPTAPLLGATMGAYETWRTVNRTKSTRFGNTQVATFTHQQIRLAEVVADIDSARLLLQRALDMIRSGGPISLEQRIRTHRDYAYIAHLCVRATERLFMASGASALYESNPMQRYWPDVHSMAAHVAFNLDAAGENFGRLELGLEFNPRGLLF